MFFFDLSPKLAVLYMQYSSLRREANSFCYRGLYSWGEEYSIFLMNCSMHFKKWKRNYMLEVKPTFFGVELCDKIFRFFYVVQNKLRVSL